MSKTILSFDEAGRVARKMSEPAYKKAEKSKFAYGNAVKKHYLKGIPTLVKQALKLHPNYIRQISNLSVYDTADKKTVLPIPQSFRVMLRNTGIIGTLK